MMIRPKPFRVPMHGMLLILYNTDTEVQSGVDNTNSGLAYFDEHDIIVVFNDVDIGVLCHNVTISI